jgi:superfamily II DNA or RNA helicase
VFSPVHYMQMVGRGLRGPKNGGTEICKIITVVDNLLQYGDRHLMLEIYRLLSKNRHMLATATALSRLKQGFDSPRERQLTKSMAYRII